MSWRRDMIVSWNGGRECQKGCEAQALGAAETVSEKGVWPVGSVSFSYFSGLTGEGQTTFRIGSRFHDRTFATCDRQGANRRSVSAKSAASVLLHTKIISALKIGEPNRKLTIRSRGDERTVRCRGRLIHRIQWHRHVPLPSPIRALPSWSPASASRDRQSRRNTGSRGLRD